MQAQINLGVTGGGNFFSRGVLVLALLAIPMISHAQVANPAPLADKARPIVVKSPPPPKPRMAKFKGTVMSATSESMTVRDRKNPRVIRTFSFSQPLHQQVALLMSRETFQYGAPVEIQYAMGSDVALRIKGKH